MRKMLKKALLLCIVLLANVNSLVQASSVQDKEVLDKYRMSVVKVTQEIVGTENGGSTPIFGYEIGTGFFINQDLIMTASHVVSLNKNQGFPAEARLGETYFKFDGNWEMYDAIVVQNDPINDIAILKVQAIGDDFLKKALPLKIEGNAENDKGNITIIGFPVVIKKPDPKNVTIFGVEGLNEYSVSTGYLIKATAREDSDKMQTTTNKVAKGYSGGPLLNSEGKVIGVLCRQYISSGEAISPAHSLVVESVRKYYLGVNI